MSPMYCGVGGVVREIKEFYCGQNGVARKISEMWAGIDGVKRKIFNSVPPLNDCTWEEISNISTAGEGANYWAIGDCKEVVLNGSIGETTLSNFSMYAFIIGFDHNSSIEGAKRIHFQLGKTALSGGTDICLFDEDGSVYMNYERTNAGGWEKSRMRIVTCSLHYPIVGSFGDTVPAELQNVIRTVQKYTNNTGYSSSSSAVTGTADGFFLLSEYEVFGNITYSNTYEANYQQQYAYYSAGNSKVKYQHNSTGSAAYWWLRSPRASNSNTFVIVSTGGRVSYDIANISLGFAPGFCV